MTAIDLFCESSSKLLSNRMFCTVKVVPTPDYSMGGWDKKTVYASVKVPAESYASANDKLRGTGDKIISRVSEFPVDILSESVESFSSRLRGEIESCGVKLNRVGFHNPLSVKKGI